MDLETKRHFYNRCAPNEWLRAGDQRYEPFDLKGLRGPDAPDRLANFIALSDEPTCQLLTGLIGSGKSTELHRFADLANKLGYFVALVNVIDREVPLVDRAKPIQIPDVLFAVCLAIQETLAGTPAEPSPIAKTLERLWNALFTRLQLTEVNVKMGVADFKVKLTTQPTFRQQLNERILTFPARLKEAVHEFVREAEPSVRTAYPDRKGLVVVLDDLEKVADTFVDRENKEAAVRDVFLTRPELVRIPCHVVYPIPPFMIQHAQELGALYTSEPIFLPMVRVRDRASNEPDSQGVKAMLAALDKRVPIREAFTDPKIAETFVLQSGGFIRDLLRFLREGIAACPADSAKIDKGIADQAIKHVQRTYREGLFEEYKEPLAVTHNTKGFPLSEKSRGLFGDLLRSHMLLRYNAEEWYDAHPLLWSLLGFGAG